MSSRQSDDLEKDNKELLDRINELKVENERLKEDNKKLRKEKDKDNDELLERINELEVENERLTDNNERLEDEYFELREEENTKKDELEQKLHMSQTNIMVAIFWMDFVGKILISRESHLNMDVYKIISGIDACIKYLVLDCTECNGTNIKLTDYVKKYTDDPASVEDTSDAEYLYFMISISSEEIMKIEEQLVTINSPYLFKIFYEYKSKIDIMKIIARKAGYDV